MTYILWLPLFFGFAFSNGLYYEYSYTTTGKGMEIRGVTRLYLQPTGKTRFETDVLHGRSPRVVPATVVLGDMASPGESTALFEDTKTYVVNRLSAVSGRDAAVVTLAGREKVDGYDCVHARITTTRMVGERRFLDTLDVWKSADVPAVASGQDWMDRVVSPGLSGVEARLRQIGCDGVLVALELRTPTAHTRQDLVKASRRGMSDALFQIPSGYTQRHQDY